MAGEKDEKLGAVLPPMVQRRPEPLEDEDDERDEDEGLAPAAIVLPPMVAHTSADSNTTPGGPPSLGARRRRVPADDGQYPGMVWVDLKRVECTEFNCRIEYGQDTLEDATTVDTEGQPTHWMVLRHSRPGWPNIYRRVKNDALEGMDEMGFDHLVRKLLTEIHHGGAL
jgi:hypothetical protein